VGHRLSILTLWPSDCPELVVVVFGVTYLVAAAAATDRLYTS
jgi:hypothetical protein